MDPRIALLRAVLAARGIMAPRPFPQGEPRPMPPRPMPAPGGGRVVFNDFPQKPRMGPRTPGSGPGGYPTAGVGAPRGLSAALGGR